MRKVLFVDDEQSVLNAFERTLEISEYTGTFCTSTTEALQCLKDESYGLVISDMRMPEMDGVAFIVEAHVIDPLSIKLVLSGYSDVQSVTQAINEGHVWRYLSKDIKKEELLLHLNNAWELYEERSGRAHLLEELNRKNEELENVNAVLEAKVAERTWELNERSEILSELLEGGAVEELLQRITTLATKMFHIDEIYVSVPFLDKTFSSITTESSAKLDTLAESAFATHKVSVDGAVAAIPLEKSGKRLGVLVVNNKHHLPVTNIQDKFERIATLISLVLYQQKVIVDAPETLKNIDTLLSEM
ncbi:MAG: response regulator [Fibrobacterales bacterium]